MGYFFRGTTPVRITMPVLGAGVNLNVEVDADVDADADASW